MRKARLVVAALFLIGVSLAAAEPLPRVGLPVHPEGWPNDEARFVDKPDPLSKPSISSSRGRRVGRIRREGRR